MTKLSEILEAINNPDVCTTHCSVLRGQWHLERGLPNIDATSLDVMRYIERLEARQQDLEQACILALSIFVNQEDIDKFPVLHQELKTVLAQHEREEAQ